jgi:type VI protein secretion system component Hcp
MKNIDKASPPLLFQVVSGRFIPSGTITFQGNGRQALEYYTIRMSEIFVSELTQTDAADPNRIFEKLVLTASKYEYEYRLASDKGATPIRVGYDCKTNKSS